MLSHESLNLSGPKWFSWFLLDMKYKTHDQAPTITYTVSLDHLVRQAKQILITRKAKPRSFKQKPKHVSAKLIKIKQNSLKIIIIS